MLKLKSQLTCSYCSKIFKDPILLPCEDSICQEHLSHRDVVEENKIKCAECSQEFQVNDFTFKSNKTLKKLIESQYYLNKEEISLKQNLEESIRIFFEFYDAFIQNKKKLDLDIFEHFQEMRFQIDEHREKLKLRIDEIALKMIDETKKSEKIYLKNLKENSSMFDDTKSLENELNEIELKFRNPNLLIDTIKEMQLKQEMNIHDFQLKLDGIAKIKDDLMVTNDFKPNLSSFNQEETFGKIRLNVNSIINSFKSEILIGERQMSELIELCEFSPSDKWSLLYRGTRDGFGSKDFHSKCDGHSNTLTIVKAKQSSYIFGGFTAVNWESSNKYKLDPNAFLFSLTNKDNKPLKMKVDSNRHEDAIYCGSEYGPTFGHDIYIANDANITINCCSNLGLTYHHPQYVEGTNEARTFLAGSFNFNWMKLKFIKKE
jgi:hypothetical protein